MLKMRLTRVLVHRVLPTSRGLILLPDSSQEKKISIGKVLDVGPDCEATEVDQMVLFGRYAPHKLDSFELEAAGIFCGENEEYLILNEEDIMCEVTKEEMKGVANG